MAEPRQASDAFVRARRLTARLGPLLFALALLAAPWCWLGRAELAEQWERIRWGWVAVGMLAAAAGIVARGAKWALLLARTGAPPPWRWYWPRYLVVYAIGGLTPLRGGELSGLLLLPVEGETGGAGRAAFVIVLDRVVELALLIVHAGLAALALATLTEAPAPLLGVAAALAAAGLLGAAALALLTVERVSLGLPRALAARLGRAGRWLAPVEALFSDIHRARRALRRPGETVLWLCAGTLIAVAFMQTAVFCLFSALIDVHPLQSLSADGLSRIASLASLLPSGIGSGTWTNAAALGALRVPLNNALAAASLATVGMVFASCAGGALGLLWMQRQRRNAPP